MGCGTSTANYPLGNSRTAASSSTVPCEDRRAEDKAYHSEADRIFRAIDADSSGTIEQRELSAYLLKTGVPSDQVEALAKLLDVDGDGTVSIEEWRDGWASFKKGSAAEAALSPSMTRKQREQAIRRQPTSLTSYAARDPLLYGAKASSAKDMWLKTFLQQDPRRYIVDYFRAGDERGPFGYLRAKGFRPGTGQASEHFAVWRPCSLQALGMLFQGTATGKGLNIKGKSATRGILSGFVPFLQISEEAHKQMVSTLPPEARTRIYYKTEALRARARQQLQRVLTEMWQAAAEGRQQIDAHTAGSAELNDSEVAQALRMCMWTCANAQIIDIDDFVPLVEATVRRGGEVGRRISLRPDAQGMYGLDVPQRLLWETCVIRKDIRRTGEWVTGRASEPAFMDLNLKALRDGSSPHAALVTTRASSSNPAGASCASA